MGEQLCPFRAHTVAEYKFSQRELVDALGLRIPENGSWALEVSMDRETLNVIVRIESFEFFTKGSTYG